MMEILGFVLLGLAVVAACVADYAKAQMEKEQNGKDTEK